LTAFTAFSLAAFRHRPIVGVFILSLLPFCVVATYFKRPLSVFKVAFFVVATIPLYLGSSGPASAFVECVRQFTPSYYQTAWEIEAAIFPSSIFCNPDWIPSRRLIQYTYEWHQLVGDLFEARFGESSESG